ncbi:MAG: hypothetical protein JO291_02985 [Acidimicrobiia bacterium]|nr:hypothetical protein [Acidimicrobiia bacterium]
MGKASSAKKVARAARAGGGRRSGQRRQLGFPMAIVAVVVVGLLLIVFARQSNQASADNHNPPQPNRDHWHEAYGLYICDRFLTNVADKGSDVLGIHTHQDGLIHIHPFTAAAAGKQATLSKFFQDTGLKVSDSSIKLPAADPFNGRLYKEGETTCGGKPAKVEVVHWKSAIAASTGAKPDKVYTSGFGGIRLSEDLGAFTFAFVPAGTKIPPPPEAGQIQQKATVDQGQTSPDSSGSTTLPTNTTPASDQTTIPTTAPASTTSPASSTTSAPG